MSVAVVVIDEPVCIASIVSEEEKPIDWTMLDKKYIPSPESFDVQEEITIDVDAGVKHRVDNDSESLSDVEVDVSELEPLIMDEFGNKDAKAIEEMFDSFLDGHDTIEEMEEEEESIREQIAEYDKGEEERRIALNMACRKARLELLEYKRKMRKHLLKQIRKNRK